ncbi:MAG: hypothetical protein KKC46_12260 [Proteobacteria bacterium]|nr:hypothetical protein [Pseudomonadota bacterium]
MTPIPPNPPAVEQFGLTLERMNYFDKVNQGKNGSIILLSIIANIIISLFLFLNTGIPFLLGIFLAICPGYVIGGKIEDKIVTRRMAKAKRLADYANYLNFKKALTDYKESLKAYKELVDCFAN